MLFLFLFRLARHQQRNFSCPHLLLLLLLPFFFFFFKNRDLRKTSNPSLTLVGHSDTVTSLALKPGASPSAAPTHLLSNSSDGTLRCWDVRPFAPAERCSRAFVGAAHSLERNLLRCCWARDDGGARVAAGSSDGEFGRCDVFFPSLFASFEQKIDEKNSFIFSLSLPLLPFLSSPSSKKKKEPPTSGTPRPPRSSTLCRATRAPSTTSASTRRSP